MELAAEPLSVTDEAELDQFLGKPPRRLTCAFRRAGRRPIPAQCSSDALARGSVPLSLVVHTLDGEAHAAGSLVERADSVEPAAEKLPLNYIVHIEEPGCSLEPWVSAEAAQ